MPELEARSEPNIEHQLPYEPSPSPLENPVLNTNLNTNRIPNPNASKNPNPNPNPNPDLNRHSKAASQNQSQHQPQPKPVPKHKPKPDPKHQLKLLPSATLCKPSVPCFQIAIPIADKGPPTSKVSFSFFVLQPRSHSYLSVTLILGCSQVATPISKNSQKNSKVCPIPIPSISSCFQHLGRVSVRVRFGEYV